MTHCGSVNIASHLTEMARQRPHALAVVFPESRDRLGRVCYTHYTYAQLHEASEIAARGMAEIGFRSGERTVFLVKPGLDFFALACGLLKVGALAQSKTSSSAHLFRWTHATTPRLAENN